METVVKNESSEFLFNAMTPEEYEKAKEFYNFLRTITKCTHGRLDIDRKRLVDWARVFMDLSTPYEAHEILMKMKEYGWIKEIKMDYVVVNID